MSVPSPALWRDVADVGTVVHVFWPSESDRRAELQRQRRPRLLLLAHDTPVPDFTDPLEDWVREPFHADELEARAARLIERSLEEDARPRLDDHGILTASGRRAVLTPGQIPLARLLVDNLGYVVPIEKLADAHESFGAPASTLQQVLRRLRTRIEPLELDLLVARGKGYQLTRR